MKRVKHPLLACLAIVVAAALVDTAVARWVWHGPGPAWYRSLFGFVTIVIPVTFIVYPFLLPAEPSGQR